ncbi:MAG: hypothetical protein GOU98_01335 [Candidatus Altiarchaeota archaeon]|nr:hypothetical protein [Candidatus Altiarchaeota archaeon]
MSITLNEAENGFEGEFRNNDEHWETRTEYLLKNKKSDKRYHEIKESIERVVREKNEGEVDSYSNSLVAKYNENGEFVLETPLNEIGETGQTAGQTISGIASGLHKFGNRGLYFMNEGGTYDCPETAVFDYNINKKHTKQISDDLYLLEKTGLISKRRPVASMDDVIEFVVPRLPHKRQSYALVK